MKDYRKKPVVIQAERFFGQHIDGTKLCEGFCIIDTLEGRLTGDIGDWIIRGVKGELYPCKDDIFRATYELPNGEPIP